jgi:hypothetical protein
VKKLIVFGMALAMLLTLGACAGNKQAQKGGQTAQAEQEAVQNGFNRLTKTQPVPSFDWSQERQTLIDTEAIRATGALSTTQFYLDAVGMVQWCPSKGAPIPSSYQLSGTKQWVDIPNDESRTLYDIDQGEPTGIYVGESTATWVLCLDDNGKPFAVYWEGPVGSTVGIVDGLPSEKRVRLNQSTYEFSEKPR